MNILTFDIEEWFHILDHDSTQTEDKWIHFESRIHSNMDRIFKLLQNNDAKATFFCMGWIAERYPEIIKEIIAQGYEIGSHTQLHQLVYTQKPQEFKSDVERSIKVLEDLSGKKVKYFRAPGFSITEKNLWAFQILHELGIEIDCSVFPAVRSHGGFSAYKEQKPSIIDYNGIKLKELPINYTTFFKTPIIYSGGGYFRLCPYSLIKKWTRNSEYVMTYFHPRDFDPGQPVLQDLPLSRKFKSYVGLRKAEAKLDKWLKNFDFIDIATADNKIVWEEMPIVRL